MTCWRPVNLYSFKCRPSHDVTVQHNDTLLVTFSNLTEIMKHMHVNCEIGCMRHNTDAAHRVIVIACRMLM